MRIFYEAWCGMFESRPSATDDLQKSIIPVGDSGHIEIRPLTKDKLKTLIIISATMHLNLDVAQWANQSQERTLEFG